MKYKVLSKAELQPLEKDFIAFLSLHGITGNDWEKMKSDQPEKCEIFIESFSDLVWEKILSNQRYLTFDELDFTYLMDFASIEFHSIRMPKNLFSDVDQHTSLALKTTGFEPENRNIIIFSFIEKGAIFADGVAYKAACVLWAKGKK